MSDGNIRVTTQRVDKHKVVYFTYEIRDQRGDLFERSDLPISYVHGVKGPLIEKIEATLEGHGVGDTVTVQVSPAEGFGEYRPELTFTDDIENVPEQYRYLGAQAEFQNDKGESITMVVSRIADGKLTVDGNHPLAGQTVMYSVTVVDIRDATASEIAEGVPQESAGQFPVH